MSGGKYPRGITAGGPRPRHRGPQHVGNQGGPPRPRAIPAWQLPLIVAALAVPVIAAIALGGIGLGLVVALAVMLALVIVAGRRSPGELG